MSEKWQLGKIFDLFKLKVFAFLAWPVQTTRMFHVSSAICSGEKFSLVRKRRRYRASTKALDRKSLGGASNTVFQLDSLKGQYAPIIPNTVRQDSWGNVLQQALTEILSCGDLDEKLQSFPVEITKVRMTRDLGNATVSWQISDVADEDRADHVQELLEQNKDLIRKLLPIYSQLSRCPQLHFTREKKAKYISDVEAVLETADYGEDYKPQRKCVPEDFFKSPYSDR